MGEFLILLSMVTGFVSFIGLFGPLPRLWLPTRKRAVVVWLASFVLLIIGGALLPDPTPEEPVVRKGGEQERQVAQGETEQEKAEREVREREREDQEERTVVSRNSVSLASIADTAAVPKAAVDSLALDMEEPVVEVARGQERVAQEETKKKAERAVREREREDQEERTVVSRNSASLASASDTAIVSEATARSELQKRGIEFTEGAFCLSAQSGDLEIVQLFVSAGMDINTSDECGMDTSA